MIFLIFLVVKSEFVTDVMRDNCIDMKDKKKVD